MKDGISLYKNNCNRGWDSLDPNFIRLLLHENLCAEIFLNIDKQTYAGNPENLAEFENDRRYIFLKADIGNVEKIENAINEFNPTSIVNFAAESHVDRSIDSPEPFIQTNVLGTLELLESTKNFSILWMKNQKMNSDLCIFQPLRFMVVYPMKNQHLVR